MALEAGSVFVKLGGLFARDEFDKWDRAIDQERAKAKDPIEAKLGADSSRLTSDLASARGQLTSFSHQAAEARVGVDEGFLARSLGTARSMMAAFDATAGGSVKVEVDLDTTAAEAKIAALKTEMALLGGDVRIGSSPLDIGPSTVVPSAIRASAGRVLSSGATQGSLLGVRGVRGPGGGTVDNPVVVTLEASRLTALGPRGAGMGYGTETDAMAAARAGSNTLAAARPVEPKSAPAAVGPTVMRDPATGRFARIDPYAQYYPSGTPIGSMPRGAPLAGDPNDPFARFPVGGGGDSGGGFPPVMPPGDGGGGGGGGGFGRFLFGAGAGLGGRRFGPFNPFRYGIHGPLGAVGAAVGLGPEHLASAALALGGSAAGGLAGAGVTALGGLGTMAVGGGSDLAVLRSTISDTQQISKAMEAVDQAVARYGKNSNQAKDATAALNTQMALLGNTAGTKAEAGLAKAADAVNQQWDKATSAARVQAVNILMQIVNLGKDYVPRVAEAARQNLSIINQGIKPLFDWLEGPHGIKIWNDLENQFKANLPTAVHAFVNAVEALLKTIDDASQYAGGFVKVLDNIATRWNNMDPKVLSDKIAHLHNDFYLWEQLIKAVSIDLYRLFQAGSGEGNDLVARFTTLLQKWGDWEKSVQGQEFLHNFFVQREHELMAILTLVGQLIHVYGQFYIALQPLVPAVTAFIRAFSSAFGTFNNIVMLPLAHALSFLLGGMADLGKYSSVFKLGFLVPMGAFLATWKLFGLDAAKNLLNFSHHIELVRSGLVGARAAMAALFAGEGVGAAWQKLKDAFKTTTPESPAASMEAAMISGGKAAGEEIAAAMVAAGREAGATIGGAEVAGGATVAAEVGSAEALGGVGAAGAGGARFLAGPGGEIVDTAAGGAAGAGGAGLLSRLRGGAGALARGVGRALPFAVTGLAAGQLYSHFTQTGNVLGRVAAGIGVGASAGAAVGAAGGGVPAIPGAIIGGLAGGGAALASALLGIGGPSKAERELASFEKQVKAIPNTANLSVAAIRKLQNQATELARKVPDAAKGLNTFWHQLERLPQTAGSEQWDKQFNRAWKAVHDFTVRGGDSIKNLRDRFDTNMRLIANTVGLESGTGQKLAEENFGKLVRHIEHAMETGKVSVQSGMRTMRAIADRGGKNMQDDMQGHMADMVQIIKDQWKKGHISTQDALDQLRQIYQDSNKKIRTDLTNHYNQLLADAKTNWQEGNTTSAQYASQRAKIHHDMAVAIQNTQIRLSQGLAGILDGTNAATAQGVDQLFSVMNNALKALNVSTVKFGVTKVANVVSSAVSGAVSSVGNILGTVPTISPGGSASNAGHGTVHAGGGYLPGGEFGYNDVMTLVDPTGRPRAHMAGDEAIFNRWQMPYVDMGLQAIGFLGGADELWNKVNRPHGYAGGGRLPAFATGGSNAGGGNVWEVRASQELASSGTGWTELSPNGNAAAFLRTARTFSNNPAHWPDFASLGQFFPNGTLQLKIRGPHGSGTWNKTDSGDGSSFAPAIGLTPAVSNVTGGTGGTVQITRADGGDLHLFPGMGRLIAGSGGFAAAPPGATGGSAGAQWTDIKTPHLTGITGPFATLGDGVLGHVTDGVNAFGKKHMPVATGFGGGLGGGLGATILAHGGKPAQVEAAMLAAARSILGKPYIWGGGHGSWFAPGYDCSGAVSFVLHAAGLLGSPQTTYTMPSAPGISPGPGKYITIGDSNARGHMMMEFFGHFFESGGGGPFGGGGPHFDPGWDGNFEIPLHPTGWARGGRLKKFASGGYLGDFGELPPDVLLRTRPDLANIPAFRSYQKKWDRRNQPHKRAHGHARGGWLGNFARGGRFRTNAKHGTPTAALYTPPKPPRKPPARHTSKPPPLQAYVQNVPGVAQFSADDASIAKLEDLYNRQESVFQLYDGGGGSLPTSDLDVLSGIRIKEWNILEGEYQSLPAIAQHLHDAVYGTTTTSQVGATFKWVGKGKHRHKVRVPGHTVTTHTAGIGDVTNLTDPGGDVGALEGQISKDQHEIDKLNNQLFKDQQAAAVDKHHITAKSLAAAQKLVQELSPLYDAILANVTQAQGISTQIGNIPPAKSLHGLRGNAYAQAQRQNEANARQRSHLAAQRSKILEGNSGLRAKIGKIMQQKQSEALKFRQEGFDRAWAFELERYHVGVKIRTLRQKISDLQKQLALEKKLSQQYVDALQAIDTRLYGGGPDDPGGTSVEQQLGDIGYDILSLVQEGADNVPQNLINGITDVLNKLGVQVPPGAISGAQNQTAAAALADFMAFQASRAQIFGQFGSNFVAAGQNPFFGGAGVGAGTQYYGAAAGISSGGSAGAPGSGALGLTPGAGQTTLNVTNNFGAGPPDPHTWSAGVTHELGAMT